MQIVDTPLSPREGVQLAHALVSSVAISNGIRALFIKGPIAGIQGLRPIRDSSDVDVLVDPLGRARLVSALEHLGWRPRPISDQGRLLPLHARPLIHDSWPCDIDIHDYYPGLFADPQSVFETLWESRVQHILAGRVVTAPDQVGNTIVCAAHLLRDPLVSRNQIEYRFLSSRVLSTFSDTQIQAIDELTQKFRALETLAPFRKDIGLSTGAKDLTADERRRWTMRSVDSTRSLGWVLGFAQEPWRSKARFAFRVVIPTEEQMRLVHPEISLGWTALMHARLSRLEHGIRQLPLAVLRYKRAR